MEGGLDSGDIVQLTPIIDIMLDPQLHRWERKTAIDDSLWQILIGSITNIHDRNIISWINLCLVQMPIVPI